MTNVILFDKPPVVVQLCSFCNKATHHVAHMFDNEQQGSQRRSICNECVEKATKLMKESE